MTTAQETLTNAFPPFPFFVENPVDLHPNDLPANNNHNSNLSSGYIDTNPLPDRCQFTFSDGRQCTMARSEIHPSLCRYHAEREDQLFGEPGSHIFGAALDLPELHSACRDLTTPAGVGRALGQVMRLLAQRRISQKEAATFGYLAQLLLQTFSATRAEAVHPIRTDVPSEHRDARDLSFSASRAQAADPIRIGVPSSRESHALRESELSRGSEKGQELSRVTESTPLLVHQKVAPPDANAVILSESALGGERRISPDPLPPQSVDPEPVGVSGVSRNHVARTDGPNPRTISTYENARLETPQNQHLQKQRGKG